MKLGYTNIDIEFYLDEQREKRGSLWYLVAETSAIEWENFVRASVNVVTNKLQGKVSDNVLSILKINGTLSQVLKLAVEENYLEAKLIQDFIHICGDKIHPALSILPMSNDRLAVIYTLSREVLKENMSPRRNIDA